MKLLTHTVLAALAACGSLAGMAFAQDRLEIRNGQIALPMTGLLVDLKGGPNSSYYVSGSWSISDDGETFDSRDVIDEFDLTTKNLVTGNWVLTGYFDAGDCSASLGEIAMTDAWTNTPSLWGQSWEARGGIYDIGGTIGAKPAVVLCRVEPGMPTLLLYHFDLRAGSTAAKASLLASARGSSPLSSAAESYRLSRTEDDPPLYREEVRQRGNVDASRFVTLKNAGLEVLLPEDGYIWLDNFDDNSDYLQRMAPSLPELSLEIAFLDGVRCEPLFQELMKQTQIGLRVSNPPAGWSAGPGIRLDDGVSELPLCRESDGHALVVGLMQTGSITEISSLYPLLHELEQAADDAS